MHSPGTDTPSSPPTEPPEMPPLSRLTLAEVIRPRYEELFLLIQRELRRSGFDEMLAGGVVLTGGSRRTLAAGRVSSRRSA